MSWENRLKELQDILIPFGISGSLSIVRAIFVPQEGSSWDKFLKLLGSMLFGGMVGVLIKHTETGGFAYKYVDYIVAASTLAANEIVTTWVKKGFNVIFTILEKKFTGTASKDSKSNTESEQKKDGE